MCDVDRDRKAISDEIIKPDTIIIESSSEDDKVSENDNNISTHSPPKPPKPLPQDVEVRYYSTDEHILHALLVLALMSQPDAKELTKTPAGFLYPLKEHQMAGLTWMIWRESLSPKGGILGT
ncbi:unnamed protein product [Angiostrongylus costaricensis]|uniref:WHIM1 domain-containing protein n=1 Tax=Angiostrongylus costaricensis TaxID=334426 RepID=A0A0R3PXF8_ANGCS|nr:unnamed protein product [Angiostrongylus costaricensis]